MVESFSLERVQKAGAIFDTEKLKWFNAQYIKKLSVADLDQRLQASTRRLWLWATSCQYFKFNESFAITFGNF